MRRRQAARITREGLTGRDSLLLLVPDDIALPKVRPRPPMGFTSRGG